MAGLREPVMSYGDIYLLGTGADWWTQHEPKPTAVHGLGVIPYETN